jgi:hypothetical protein
MARMLLTEELIVMDLKTLNHGGIQAVTLFMNMSKRIYEAGANGALRDWITIAAPSLPEKERNEILAMLMCSYLFLGSQSQAQRSSRASSAMLH